MKSQILSERLEGLSRMMREGEMRSKGERRARIVTLVELLLNELKSEEQRKPESR